VGFLKRKEVILLLRLIVGATFIYAAWDKVLHPHAFAIAVRGYQIVPVSVSNLFALALAWAEMVAAVLLIAGLFTRQAAGAILLMLVMFIGAIATVMIRGLVIDCGCFSSEGGSQVGPLLIVRNILLIAACVVIMRYDRGAFSLGRLVPTRG
jgi:uncharacterized membrane protein YphA (DoxX/SURF4 family)